jgi:hypothetical protein
VKLIKGIKGLVKLIAQAVKDVAGSFTSPKPVIVITIGVLLVLVGQLGILIPVFPGLALTIPGLILLSLYSPTIYKTLKRKTAGHPKLESAADRSRNWLIKLIKPRQ